MSKIINIICNGRANPIGIDAKDISFSWQIQSDEKNIYQKEYRVYVWDEEENLVWDSGIKQGADTAYILYAGEPLKSRETYQYQVESILMDGTILRSERMYFEMGLLKEEDWSAKWIGREPVTYEQTVDYAAMDQGKIIKGMMAGEALEFEPDRKLEQCNRFYREFYLEDAREIKKARIYAAACGIYQIEVNGKQVLDTLFAPGFTRYDKTILYQTYDVSEMLCDGKNQISFILADGWYKGKFGMLGIGDNYGSELEMLLQMEITYTDGYVQTIATDEQFCYTPSPYLYSDILIGEKYDARLEEYKSEGKKAMIWERGYEMLYADSAEPVRPVAMLEPVAILKTPKGETVVDFGQNFAGVVEFTVHGALAGTEIKLEHSEVLDKDGNFIQCIDGFNRDQTDIYICKGAKTEVYRPKFTFHGFRYVRVTGYPGNPAREDFKGISIGSDLAVTGSFYTSDERLNQLQSNIFWSQRSNLLSIPMDCPQRERAGWTGDVWVYAETCCYNQNCLNFFKRWLKSVRDEQFDDGLIPIVVPYIKGYRAPQMSAWGTHTSAGWGDVIVSLPWTLYQIYGDVSVLEENYEAMQKWMGYVRREAEGGIHLKEGAGQEALERQKYLWNTNFHFGDWLYPSCKDENGKTDMMRSAYTTKELTATAIYANSTAIMEKVSRTLNKKEEALFYQELNQQIRQAFAEEYIDEDGRVEQDLQGLYVLALAMDMVPKEKKPKMVEHLARKIAENHNCLDTGFMSIKFLMDVLLENGLADEARKVLFQENAPSWLYEVKHGATTIWETWTSILPDGTPTNYSYNHYAFGCVGDWMYKNLLGIQKLSPGYKDILIKPDFRFGLNEVKGSFSSVYGEIHVHLKKDGDDWTVMIQVPANTTAYLELPNQKRIQLGNGKFIHCYKG